MNNAELFLLLCLIFIATGVFIPLLAMFIKDIIHQLLNIRKKPESMREYRILVRRDYLETLSTINPILREHELYAVYDDTDETKVSYKIGDGYTPFNDLPFVEKISDIEHFEVYTPGHHVKIDLKPTSVRAYEEE